MSGHLPLPSRRRVAPPRRCFRPINGRFTALCAALLALAGHPVLAEPSALFGAISYSAATRIHGLARNFTSERDAVVRALNDCESKSGRGDCRILVTFRNGCGALAESSDGAYGSGWGVDRERARYYATDVCADGGGLSCAVTQTICSGAAP